MRVASLSAILALAFAGCGGDHQKATTADGPPVQVRVAPVFSGSIPLSRELPGTVRPRDHAQVAARVMGLVTQADFAVGQRVHKGEPLVQLSAQEIDARVAQAHTALEQARLDYQREASLLEHGASTREQVRKLDERMRMAESALTEAETLQGYTQVSAPFDGRITAKLVNAGDLATPGSPLFDLEDDAVLRVEVQVPESLPELPLGSTVDVRLGGEPVAAKVVESSPAADSLSRTRLVKLELPTDAGARSGQFARVLWPEGHADTIAVPAAAISPLGQMERAFLVKDGRAELRLVRTGMTLDGGNVQVLAGLDAGETVVVDPPPTLRNGQPLEIKQ